MTSETTEAPPLGKFLASTEKNVRDKAIKNLKVFLSDPERNEISKPEMAKLWKGIFYGFWMSDKPLVQQALATELANLVLVINTTDLSLAFLRGFWETIVREWNGIDRLRIDKYYMLLRRFVNASFRLLIQCKWDQKAFQEYNDILTADNGPLCPTNPKVPVSLAYHLADIYAEELDKAMASNGDSIPPPAPLRTVLIPFVSVAAQASSSTTYKRIQSALFEPLLTAFDSPSDAAPPSSKRQRLQEDSAEQPYSHLVSNSCYEDPSEGALEAAVLRKKVLRLIFEVASQEETRDSNRRKMYALYNDAGGEEDS